MLRQITFALLATFLLISAEASAQSSPAPYTKGIRYDALGRVVGTIAPDPDGTGSLKYAAIRNTYDAHGDLTKVETGELASWMSQGVAPSAWTGFTVLASVEYTYDNLHRKVMEVAKGANGAKISKTQFGYYDDGRLQCTAVRMNPAVYDSENPSACSLGTAGSSGPDRIAKNVYDAAGELIQVRKAVGTSIEQAYATYSYTSNGKQEYVIDARGNRAKKEYDGFDRQVKWIFPSTALPANYSWDTQANALLTAGPLNTGDYELYGYDANGNRISLRKRDGSDIAYSYDALNRMTVKDVDANNERGDLSATDKRDVYYKYDLRGLQLHARFGSATGVGLIMTYDGFGRMLTAQNTLLSGNPTLSFQYDKDGNRTRITHPDNARFDMIYDGLDRFINATWWTSVVGTVPFTAISYNQAGQRTSINRASSYTNYGYGTDQRLSSLAQTYNGGSGNVTQTFPSYNAAGQLLQTVTDNTSYSYTARVAVTTNYTANGLNQYSTVASNGYCYDANGNLTFDGGSVYKYDVENRLVEKRAMVNSVCASLSYAGALQVSLHYDPMGRLYEEAGSSGTTRLLYDGDKLVGEYSTAGALLRRYMWGDRTDEPIMKDEGTAIDCSGTRVFQTDRQGSIIATADCWGNLQRVYRYDDYGWAESSDSSALTPANGARFLYTGQAWLPDLGMYYYKARIYSPKLGRFMQTDPIGYDDQINLYAYVGNDPVNGTDPTGTYECQGSTDQCKDFKVYFKNLQDASLRPQTGTHIRDPRLNAAVKQLGKEGDGGIAITFKGEPGANVMGSYTPEDSGPGTINLDYAKINLKGIDAANSSGLTVRKAKGLVGGAVLAHEAYHATWRANPASTMFGSGRNQYFNEFDAYQVEQNYYGQWGQSKVFGSSDIGERAFLSCLEGALSQKNANDSNQYEAGCRSGR